jgi:hypothetical protein
MQSHVPGLYVFSYVSAALQDQFKNQITNMAKQQLNGSVHNNRKNKKQRAKFLKKIENYKQLDERDQQVALLNMSKEQYRQMRDFIKQNMSDPYEPQGLKVDHSISWAAGDNLINTVSSGISRLTGNSSIPSGNPSQNLNTPNKKDDEDIDETDGSTKFSGVFLRPDPTPALEPHTMLQDLMDIIGSTEFAVTVVVVNLITYGLHRRKINLVLALAVSTMIIIKETQKSKDGSVQIISDVLGFQQTMASWMDNNETNLDDQEVVMEEVPVPQGFGDINSYLVEVIVAFVSLGLGIKAKSPFFHTISNMMKVSDRAKENMASTLLNVSNRFSNFFRETVKNDCLATFFHVEMVSDEAVKELLNNIQEYMASCNAGTALCEGYRDTIYATLMDDIRFMLHRLDKHSFDYKTLSNAHNEILKQNTFQKTFSKALSGDRIEPVGVLVYGTPGTMKTIFYERIQKLVARYTIPAAWRNDYEENSDQFIFPLPNDKFFDNYNYRAWVVTVDDIFQKRETAGDTDPESVKVIKMINTAPYLLPMAQASEKNSRYFRSPFVIATTNLPDFNLLQAVVDPKAVERRFNIRLDVTVNSKYLDKKGKLCFAHLPSLEFLNEDNITVHSSYIPEDFWNIVLIEHKASVKLKPRIITFDEAVRVIIQSHRDKIKNFYINKQTTKITYESMIKKLDDEFLDKSNSQPIWKMKNLGDKKKPKEITVPQGLLRGGYNDNNANPTPDDLEIRSMTDAEGNRVYCPQPRGMRWDSEDNCYRPSEDKPVLPDDSISQYELKQFFSQIKYRKHEPTEEMPNGMPGSFTGGNWRWTRFHHNPLMEYIYQNHPTMYEGFAEGMYLSLMKNRRIALFDEHFVMLNLHLAELDKVSRDYILDGLKNGYFFDRLEASFKKCDDENLDYFTLVPKFWIGFTKINKLYQKVKKFGSKIYSFIKKYFVTLLFSLGIIGGAAFFLWKTYKKIFGTHKDDNDPQSVDQSRMASRGYAQRVGRPTRLSQFVQVSNVAQGLIIDSFKVEKLPKLTSMDIGERTGTSDILAKCINKYFFIAYIFYREKDTGKTAYNRLGHMTNVVGNLFIHPFHYVFQIVDFMQHPNRDSFQLVMVTTTKTICYRFPIRDFLDNFHTTDEAADEDNCIFVCNHAQNTSAGILRYVVNNEDVKSMSRLSRIKSGLLGTYNNIEGKHLALRMKDIYARQSDLPNYVNATWTEQQNDTYAIERSLVYEADLSAGDCGSLLYTKEGNFQNRIIMGMHIAGTSTRGFSTMLVYEDLIKMIDACGLNVLHFTSEIEPDFVDYIPISDPQGCLQSIGNIHKDETPSHALFSSIKKSKLYGKLPPPYDVVSTMPAYLNKFTDEDGNEINPAEISLKAYKRSPGCIPYEYIENAVESYEQKIRDASVSYTLPRTVIGIREALHHFRDVKPIASSTSPGHPMNLPKYVNLKKLYFKSMELGETERAEGYFQQIATEVERVLELYKSYIRPFFMYTDNNKDEVRKKEKALKGLTRLFSGSPFVMLIIFRMYFGAFMDMFFSANIDVGSAIGVNPYSMDWDRMARKLQQFGKRHNEWLVGAGDFAFFDGHEQVCIMQPICTLIINWYGGGMSCIDNKIRYFLWAEITNSRHVFWGKLYEWYCSMPSGNPLTAIINTIYNNLTFRIAWQFADLEIDFFNSWVYMVALGDDVLFSVAHWVIDKFNELLMPDLMARCGMIYTNELKETATIPFRRLEEVEFLKRGFVKHRGLNRWIAPLRVDSIISMLCWTKKKNGDQIAVDNIGIALREFSLHGEEVYEYWYTVLMNLWNSEYPFISMNSIISGTHSIMFRRVLDTVEFTF